MFDALAVLIRIPYVLYTTSMSEKILNVVYFVSDAIAVLLKIPYMFYTLSMSEKNFNGVISCGRCFSRSH